MSDWIKWVDTGGEAHTGDNMKDTIIIDGITYQRVNNEEEQRCIVMMGDGGLTMVGLANFNGQYPVLLRDAQCPIRWGTSAHLAQLANDGPRPNTKLGDPGSFVITRPPIGYFPCSAAWDK